LPVEPGFQQKFRIPDVTPLPTSRSMVASNTIIFKATGQDLANIDQIQVF
jgi:hypothetical protein